MNQINKLDLHDSVVTEYIDVKGVPFAYRQFGRMGGIPLFLFQHFTGTMDNWDPAVTNGLAQQHHVVLFDNKGIGGSAGETPSTIDEMAEDAIEFIKALKFELVNLLGFSMGGFITQVIVLKQPALVNKIILVGTATKSGEGISGIVGLITHTAAFTPDDLKLYFFYEKTESSRSLGQAALKRINKRSINRDPETRSLAVQAQLASILNWATPGNESLHQLNHIKHPVLIINGSNDIVVPTINSYTLFQALPNAKLSLYPDSGHGSIFQYPQRFLDEAIPFLDN